MVVADDAQRTDARFDQELSEDALDLGLTRLEIVSTDERFVLFGEFDTSRDECVLRSTVDEGNTLEDATDGKDCRGRDFRVTFLDALDEIRSRIIDTGYNLSITFSVGSPNNNDFIQIMFSLERFDIIADVLDMFPFIVSGDQIICAGRLIRRNKRRVIDRWKRLVLSELFRNLTLDIIVQDFGASHGGGQVKGANIPSAEDKVIGMDHWENLIEWGVDVVAIGIDAQFHGGRLSDTAIIIGFNQTVFGVESDLVAVGSDGGSQRTAIVTSPSNQHQPMNQPGIPRSVTQLAGEWFQS